MIVYLIENKFTNEKYVGVTTKSFEDRISKHLESSRSVNSYLYRAIRRYGADNFSGRILCHCTSIEVLAIMETFYIMVYGSHISDGGYNMNWGGWSERTVVDLKSYIDEKLGIENYIKRPSTRKFDKYARMFKRKPSLKNVKSPHVGWHGIPRLVAESA